jgi:hypothetical protein
VLICIFVSNPSLLLVPCHTEIFQLSPLPSEQAMGIGSATSVSFLVEFLLSSGLEFRAPEVPLQSPR